MRNPAQSSSQTQQRMGVARGWQWGWRADREGLEFQFEKMEMLWEKMVVIS